MPTNVPAPSLTDAGLQVPEELAVLTGVFADLQAAFGGNLNPDMSTPQGQLASSLAALIGSNNDTFLALANGFDPSFASGRMQEALGRIYFLERNPASRTTVPVTLGGAVGASIPAGSLAQATDGTVYRNTTDATISSLGTASATFEAVDTGPIICPAFTLTRIYRTIPGWDSITNTSDGTPGGNVETRSAFEQRRAASVAANALGVLPAIRGAVLGVPGVQDVYVTENDTAASKMVNGVTLARQSLYVAVAGGSDQDVAEAIWSRKPPGCAYVGNTVVSVRDEQSGYAEPVPTYSVRFQRPATQQISVTIDLASNPDIPSDALGQIRAAIVAAFRPRIGGTVFASALYGPIARLGDWAQIIKLNVNGAERVAVNIGQFPVIDPSNVSIAIV